MKCIFRLFLKITIITNTKLFKSKDVSRLRECKINNQSIKYVLPHHLLKSVVYFNDIANDKTL